MRTVKPRPIRDNFPFFLAGTFLGLLLVALSGYPHYGPVVQRLLSGPEAPPVESTLPPAENPVPAEDTAPPAEAEAPPAQTAEGSPSSAESAAPSPEPSAPPADTAAPRPEEGSEPSFWRQLWSKAAKLWPALLVLIAVMEAAEYLGKLAALLRRFFRFLGDRL